jgi:U3 small nucleolar RNA-associated protein 20
LNYESQLLSSLGKSPLLAEKHSRLLIPQFFSIARHAVDDDDASTHLSTRQLQQRTSSYLELLAKFVNPKAAFRTEELHTLYLDILSKGEPKLQTLALSCLLTYKSPNLVPYEDYLKALLEESKFRDTLTHFQLGVDSEVINPEHRHEIVSVSIRLLYGIMTSRRGRGSTSQGLAARKQAVLTSMSGCTSEELVTLVDLMLEPFGKGDVVGRQQLGYLSLLHDVLRYLAPQTADHWARLLQNTIDLVSNAQARLTKDADQAMEVDGDDDAEEEEEDEKVSKGLAPLRNVRSTGIKRLVQFLRSNVDFDFSPYMVNIFSSIISPRLDKLEVENTQAPSGTLEIIAALAASAKTARSLIQFDERALPKTFACMTAVRVKPSVIARVFDIIDSLLADEDENDDKTTTKEVLLPHIKPLLENIIGLVSNLGQTGGVEDLTKRLLSILSRLSSVVSDGQQAQQLATLLGPMLRQSGRQMPEKAKMNVLNTLQRLYAISPDFADTKSEFFTRNYDLISNLFQSLFYPASRRALVGVLETFGVVDQSLKGSIKVVADINAYSTRRMEEPDFDRRLTAFASITDGSIEELPKTTREWLPLIRSVLFFIQEPEELSIRTNASAVLRRFVELVGNRSEGVFVELLQHAIVPGLKRALRSKLELVRGEALLVFSHAIKTCEGVAMLRELQPLLGQGEEDDTNFFINISHIQVHRRARALRRLRDTISEHDISEASLSTIFLPILDHIIAGSTDVTDHHLINEAILTVGGIAGKLKWSRYNTLVMRYLRLGQTKTPQQKLYIRAVSSVIDHFHFDLGREKEKGEDVDVVDVLDTDAIGDEEEDIVDAKVVDGATSTRISEVVLSRILPALGKFVAQKDEADDTVRIPLALPTVKLASRLPGDSANVEVLKTISTISQILRSKDQDTRDIARDTICKITVFLGPEWLVRVIKELRTALQRGPQKHVVAVVTHAILVLATTEAADRFGNLDEAVQEAVEISAEVIWGESGKDVANEGFKTKMREVRGASSRGFDTFQLVSRLVTPAKIGAVLTPLREVMHASQAVKTMQHVDETLRRITIGLNANPRLHPEDLLNLVHSLISGDSSYIKPKRKAPKGSQAADSHRVQMKRDMKEDIDFYHLNAHKFVAFGLDLFVTAFRRGKFAFDNPDILSRLGPLVNTVGNTLYSPTSSVLLLGLKATAAIARCPLPQIEPALPVYIANIFKTIKNAGGTAETELAQTALKTLAVILRDCKSSSITDSQLKYLLEIITPDLEETDRQASVFAILRSVVSRKLVVPEIYDLMERVSGIMITSQSTHVQEQCRGALMAFLLDYPQGEGRLKNQMTFLARNLSYEFESGRVSVMELLGAGLSKFSEGLIEDYGDLWLISLVQVFTNDDSEKCRNMAGALIRGLYLRFEGEHRVRIRGILNTWVEGRDESPELGNAALGVYGLLADVEDEEDLQTDLIKVVDPVVVESARSLAKAEASDSVFDGLELDYATPNYALTALSKAIKVRPGLTEQTSWDSVVAHLLFPHDWVRFAATKCLVMVVSGDRMLELLGGEEGLLDIAKKCCLALRGSKSDTGDVVVVDGKLADQIVKLLFNISKHWAVSCATISTKGTADMIIIVW